MESQQTSSLINTWVKCYQITQRTQRNYKTRLAELETWDTSNNNPVEREAKIEALKKLIN